MDGIADWGLASDVPVVGDWDNNGTTTMGVWRDGQFFLSNHNLAGPVEATVLLGDKLDIPLAGRWSGAHATVGVRRGSNFLLSGSSAPQPGLSFTAAWGAPAIAR